MRAGKAGKVVSESIFPVLVRRSLPATMSVGDGTHLLMPSALPIYLHVLRKRSGLSQRELAFLLRISPAMLSKLERLERTPSKAVIIATEIIFGAIPRDAFPSFYESVETKVMRQ